MQSRSRLTAIRNTTDAAARAAAIRNFFAGFETRNALPGYSAEAMTQGFIAMLAEVSSWAAAQLTLCVQGTREFKPIAVWNQAVNCLEDINDDPECLRKHLPKQVPKVKPLALSTTAAEASPTASGAPSAASPSPRGQNGPPKSPDQLALEARLKERGLLH